MVAQVKETQNFAIVLIEEETSQSKDRRGSYHTVAHSFGDVITSKVRNRDVIKRTIRWYGSINLEQLQ
jgi:hypothetical protein